MIENNSDKENFDLDGRKPDRKSVLKSVGLGLCALALTAFGAWAQPVQETAKTGTAAQADVIAPKDTVMMWGDASDPDSKVRNGKPLAKGWISLFDGKTLKGWNYEKGYWEVLNGAIHGDKKRDTPNHHYMFTDKDYKDFECHIDVKMVGYNSGVCARINPKNFDDVPGYQVDMGDGYWGCLWDEHHRQVKIFDYPKEEADKILHKDDWNHYYFKMNGPHIVIYLNGVKTAEGDDPGGFASGPLGFQLCHGANTVADFRHIYVKLLSPALSGTAPKSIDNPVP